MGLHSRGYLAQGTLWLRSTPFSVLRCYSTCTGTVIHTSQELVKIKHRHQSVAQGTFPGILSVLRRRQLSLWLQYPCGDKGSWELFLHLHLNSRSLFKHQSLCSHLPPVPGNGTLLCMGSTVLQPPRAQGQSGVDRAGCLTSSQRQLSQEALIWDLNLATQPLPPLRG